MSLPHSNFSNCTGLLQLAILSRAHGQNLHGSGKYHSLQNPWRKKKATPEVSSLQPVGPYVAVMTE